MSESKTSERRLSAVERQRKALELRKAGAGYQYIADQLGYKGVSGAYKAVQAGLKKTLQEPADSVRKMETERLDALFLAVWNKARQGDLQAVDRVLRIMDRRAQLLGIDAPKRINVNQVMMQQAEEAAKKYGLPPDEVLSQMEKVIAEWPA